MLVKNNLNNSESIWPVFESTSWISWKFVPDLVSVLIPTYNREQCLMDALDSDLAQVHLAKKNLNKFSLVGFIEKPHNFFEKFIKMTGLKIKLGQKEQGACASSCYRLHYTARDPRVNTKNISTRS